MLQIIGRNQWTQETDRRDWIVALAVHRGTSRVQLLATWDDGMEASPIVLDIPQKRETQKFRLSNTFSLVEEFALPLTRPIVALCAHPPVSMAWRTSTGTSVGRPVASILPASLDRRMPELAEDIIDFGVFAAKLKECDLEGALKCFSEARLRGMSGDVQKMTAMITEYLGTHPLHRSAHMGVFVGALSGAGGIL